MLRRDYLSVMTWLYGCGNISHPAMQVPCSNVWSTYRLSMSEELGLCCDLHNVKEATKFQRSDFRPCVSKPFVRALHGVLVQNDYMVPSVGSKKA